MIEDLLRIRLLVAALGERLPTPWWRSQFLTTTGIRYMDRIFPRLSLVAALISTTLAARREHDTNLGIQAYHLFRLPAHLEDQLMEFARNAALKASVISDSTDDLMTELQRFDPDAKHPFGSGPKVLGRIGELLNPHMLGCMASMYATAAREQTRVYPYFE
ncbi:MAG: BrxE family protein [Planctomycetaceae bacterium]|nr:MAG: BrxE family protein [Planctomycetaceae bacterium]